jgi:hypothetical protein
VTEGIAHRSIHCWGCALSSSRLMGAGQYQAIVTEAQHIQGSIVLGHRRETRHVSYSLVAAEDVEQSAVQHCSKPAPQTLQLERVTAADSTSITR